MGVNVPSGYKQTKVGVIPEEWEVVTFNDLRDTDVSHSITGGPFGSNLKSEHYTDTGVRIIQLQNIGDGSFINKDFIYTTEEKAIELKSCLIYPDDIILAKMAEPVARACIIPSFENKFLMGSDGIRLHIDKNKYDNKFILESINYKQFRQIAIARSTGSTRQRIGLSDLRKIPIIIPPLKEQQKIAQILTTWDSAISKQEALIEAKEILKKGLMQKLLSGEVRFDGFDGEWEEVRLGDIAFKKSSSVSANSIENNSGKYIIYGASGVLQKIDFYMEKDPYISIVKDGAGVGRVFLCNSYSSVLGTMDIIKSKSGVNLYFLYSLLQQFNFMKYMTGSTIPHIYFKDYSKIKIKLPAKQEQQKIAQVLTTADKEIALLKEELEALKEQKRGLMQKLLTGEVRVRYE